MDGVIICSAVLILCGTVFVLASLRNRGYLFRMRKVRWADKLIGRKAARILYGVLGALMIIFGILVWFVSF